MNRSTETKPKEDLNHAIQSINDWVTVTGFCELFPNIPEKTIRWQLTNRRHNGLSKHVQTIGKQLFISISGYSSWLNPNNEEV